MEKYLFVYGTLQKGYGLNAYLKNAKFVADAQIKGFKLLGYFGIPFAVKEKKSNIKGEIYLLNEDFINNDLIKIDIIEGSYSRIKSTAQMDNGKNLPVELYEYKGNQKYLKEIPQGDFKQWKIASY